MKIPKTLNICGQKFKVGMKSDRQMKDAIGLCYAHKNIMYLQDDLPKDKMGETLIHEVIHAIEQQMNLKMTENQVNNLALGLYQFLKENKIAFR